MSGLFLELQRAFLGHSPQRLYKEVFDCLIELLQNLGFEINWKKVVPPTQCLTFLGVPIDTVSKCLSLPQEELPDLQLFVQDFLHQHRQARGNCNHFLASKIGLPE